MDTVIFDDEIWRECSELTEEILAERDAFERFKLRRRRVELFLKYLQLSEERWVVECNRRELTGAWTRELIAQEIIPALDIDLERAVHSARGSLRGGQGDRRIIDHTVLRGVFSSVWPDKDYAFIRQDDGPEWFAHRSGFESPDDWEERRTGGRCSFVAGEWKDKPRALKVRVRGA